MSFLCFHCIHVKCLFVAMKKRFKPQLLDVVLPGLIRNHLCVLRSKHIKVSKERYLLGQKHTLQIFAIYNLLYRATKRHLTVKG